MNKFDQLASFVAVVEENGFAAAARKQNLSTAAISKQITQLECRLKAVLLTRTTRQIRLTEVGQNYYQHCKKILHELIQADTAIQCSQQEAVGVLKVTSSRYFAIKYLLPRLSEFMSLNPKLSVQIELAERFPNLAEENIDLIFGVSLEGPQELVRKRVATTRYVLCASSDYLKKYGTPETPNDLNKHFYITHSMRKPANLISFKGDKHVYVEPILSLNDSQAMCECAVRGMGIIKLHEYIVRKALLEEQLVEILKEFQEPKLPVYLYYQQSKYLQPKIRKFIDFYTNPLIDNNFHQT